MFVDANFEMVGSHIEEMVRRKIENFQYVDSSKLIPKDRIQSEEDHRMVMLNKNGETYWVPYTDVNRDRSVISSYQKWDVAFRVFSDVLTRKFPEKSTELIQYNHVIHTASLTYNWENVYNYDKDFRMHISKYPTRSWGIILQQSWNIRMKDKFRTNNNDAWNSSSPRGGKTPNNNRGKKDICWRFNRGRCTYGMSCKFDHKCGICNKFGHGAHNCRKLNNHQDQGERQDRDRTDRKGEQEERKMNRTAV